MFKKIFATVLMLTMFSGSALAADVTVKMNGEVLPLPTNAYIKNDRTMVPLRGVFEAVGASVNWDNDTKTVMIAQMTESETKFIFLSIGSDTAFINSVPKTLEAAPEITNEYTMVPLHFIMDELGTQVTWDGAAYTVNIVTE